MSVPKDLVIEILLKLPVESIVRLKCVCKSWYSTINSPDFIAQHQLLHLQNDVKNTSNLYLLVVDLSFCQKYTRRLSYDTLKPVPPVTGIRRRTNVYPPISIPTEQDHLVEEEIVITRCCCNGLILFCFFCDELLLLGLWNPATGQTKLLPSSSYYQAAKLQNPNETIMVQVVGLGFDTKTMDYKVVVICNCRSCFVVEMYSLKTNSWATIATLSDDDPRTGSFGPYWFLDCYGVFSCNGMLSCIARDYRYDDGQPIIISVDISNETVITTCFPCCISHVQTCFALVNYKDSFALVSQQHRENTIIDIWVLGEYGVKESWKKLLAIGPFPPVTFVLGFWKDGKVLLKKQINSRHKNQPDDHKEMELLLFDTATQKTTSLNIYFDGLVFIYRETLVQLN